MRRPASDGRAGENSGMLRAKIKYASAPPSKNILPNENKVVILQHYPIANKPDNELYYTYNSVEYLKMLHNHKNVLAVVSGHYHKNEEVMFDGVNHITSPDASRGFYKIIEIDLDSNEIYTIVKEIK